MPSHETSRTELALIRMGSLSDLESRIITANLQTILGISARLHGSVSIPEEAFIESRRQYDAGILLKNLSRHSVGHFRVLAVTNVDLCTPILTYVYGQAELGGRIAVISTARLREDPGGCRTSRNHYYDRLVKVALHEVAHTFSIYHCVTARCLMQFSSDVQQLDHLDIWFCNRCEFILRRTMAKLRIPDAPASP